MRRRNGPLVVLGITILHPSEQALVAFAEGEPLESRDRLTRHLERCSDCRRFVAFTRRVTEAVAALPDRRPDDALLARALADRAAGERVILRTSLEPPRPGPFGRAASAAALLAALTIVGVWWHGRGVRADIRSTNELLLAGLVRNTAATRPAGRAAGSLTHRLRPLTVTYQRRFVESASGRTTDAGKLDLHVARAGSDRWGVTSSWREIVGLGSDMQGARSWTDSLTVAEAGLEPLSRTVHVRPFRKWAGIRIDQRFRGDSVVGQMSLDENPTRRPIARDLRADRDRLIASDALSPLYFMGVPLRLGARFDVSVLGWAVVPNDVVVRFAMAVTGSERVETPAGTFDCWRFVITVGDDTHFYWVRKSDHLGILTRRHLKDGRILEIVLAGERPGIAMSGRGRGRH